MNKHLFLKVMSSVILACLLGLSAFAQSKDETVVKGIITDKSNNEPLIGAIVWVKDTPFNAITGLDGDYELKFTGNYGFATVSLMGYKDVDIQVTPGKTMTVNVALEPDGEMLEEAVAVGYGTQKKASIVGAISTIEPDALKVPVSKLSNALSGRLSGVVAVQRSGEPGEGSSFWIRGMSTFGANSTPLVLVDGIERSLDLVDVEDIKEFSILKDASATAVYGVRGANGVVLVTTRSGEEGKPKINVKHETGLVTPTKVPEMANAAQFMEMYNSAQGKDYFSQEYIQSTLSGADPYIYPNVDWVNEIFKKYSYNTRTNLSVSGGTNTVKYFVSGGFYNENGLFNQDPTLQYNTGIFYRKFNFRSNVDIQLFKHTSMTVKLATAFEQRNSSGTSTSSLWSNALITPAVVFPTKYEKDGEVYWAGAGAGQGTNPLAMLTQTGYCQNYSNNAQSVFGLDHDFSYLTDGLKGSVKFSFDANNYHYQNRTRTPSQWSATRNADGELELIQLVSNKQDLGFSYGSSGWRAVYLEANLNYARSFGKHGLTGLLLYQQSSKNYVGSSATDSEAAIPYRHQGLAFRATYNYDSRYFLEFNAGYNGSENFSPGHRFGFFPSVAAGWLVSDEAWWQPIKKAVSFLKFKGSYGLVGNDQISGSRFVYLESINDSASGTYFGESISGTGNGIALGDWPNENVGWETSEKFDIGFEAEFFNALKLNVDYFHEYRSGIFLQRQSIPNYVGIATQPYANVGKMRNSGIDASMTYDQQIGEVHLSALANFTFSRNVVLDKDEPVKTYPYQSLVGQAHYQKLGLVSDGLFQSWEDIETSPDQSFYGNIQPGDIKYKDINGDGVINDFDTKPIGYTDYPEITYGFGVNAQWKGIDVSVFFQGIDHVSFSLIAQSSTATLVQGFSSTQLQTGNVFADVYGNYWTEDNPNAKYPRLTVGKNTNNSQASDFWMVDGSYLRLKNVELGYTLPKHLTQKIRISNLRVFLSGTNLLTFSKFKLWDPDLQTGAANYPNNKTFNIGLNLAF